MLKLIRGINNPLLKHFTTRCGKTLPECEIYDFIQDKKNINSRIPIILKGLFALRDLQACVQDSQNVLEYAIGYSYLHEGREALTTKEIYEASLFNMNLLIEELTMDDKLILVSKNPFLCHSPINFDELKEALQCMFDCVGILVEVNLVVLKMFK
jgi:hypothetical protein